jgi:hypothetical protein
MFVDAASACRFARRRRCCRRQTSCVQTTVTTQATQKSPTQKAAKANRQSTASASDKPTDKAAAAKAAAAEKAAADKAAADKAAADAKAAADKAAAEKAAADKAAAEKAAADKAAADAPGNTPAAPPVADEDESKKSVAPSATDSSARLPMREWIDNTGKYQVRARLVEVREDGIRILKENERYVSVSFARLSADDLQYIQSIAQSQELSASRLAAR